MLYFAYGSNMSEAQMRQRCPAARFHAVAALPAHELCFPRWSAIRRCGVASVRPAPGGIVWGAVYALTGACLASLDACEGFQPGRDPRENRYNRAEIVVHLDGDRSRPVAAFAYIAVVTPGAWQPNAAYRQLMIDGAVRWSLPADYVEQLRGYALAPAKPDEPALRP